MEASSPSSAPASLRSWDELDFCGELEHPGQGLSDEQSINFTNSRTSQDQLAIEDYLERQGQRLHEARLLHVGIGNSSLALRLHHCCRAIDGITVTAQEAARAQSLHLSHYRVFLLNKYSVNFVRTLQPGYTWIIDNNPNSFACCRFHYARMLESYRWALAPGGQVLVHRRGLSWVAADKRWHASFDDLSAAASRFGLRADRIGDDISSLIRE